MRSLARSGEQVRRLRIGAFGFEVRSPFRAVLAALDHLYRDYPALPEDDVADYLVSVAPASRLRRHFRPKLLIQADFNVHGAAPMPLEHGLLAAEMGMNLQIALGMSRFLLLHAGAVERDGGGVLMCGDSGSGKSTLAAWLGHRGWRFLGDEFAMIDPEAGQMVPCVRPISLKNESIALLGAMAPPERFGPLLTGTVKGTIRHLAPPVEAIRRADDRAAPRLFLLPRFDASAPAGARPLDRIEVFTAIVGASTNYPRMGEVGFDAACRLAETVAGYELVYPSSDAAGELIDILWARHG